MPTIHRLTVHNKDKFAKTKFKTSEHSQIQFGCEVMIWVRDTCNKKDKRKHQMIIYKPQTNTHLSSYGRSIANASSNLAIGTLMSVRSMSRIDPTTSRTRSLRSHLMMNVSNSPQHVNNIVFTSMRGKTNGNE